MEKDKAYYFRFSPQKWLSAVSKVQLLNHEEKGIYWDLCCMIFCENGKINYDDLLCRKMRIEKAKLTNCLNLLFNLNLLVLENGFLYSKYMSEELEIIKEMSQKRRVSGAAGGRPKKQTKASLSDKDNDKDNDKDKKEDIKEKNSNMLFPKSLNNEDFYKAWELWENHYKNVKHKLITPQQRDVQLMRLARVGSEKAISMIENSIAKGWLDIYELDEKDITDPSEARRKAFEEL